VNFFVDKAHDLWHVLSTFSLADVLRIPATSDPLEPAMRTFLISYDLANPYANRHVIAQAIMEAGQSWARPLESTWYVKSDAPPAELEDKLQSLLGSDDGLLVQAVKGDAAMAGTTLRWFRQRRPAFDMPENSNVVAFPVIARKQTSTEGASDGTSDANLAEAG